MILQHTSPPSSWMPQFPCFLPCLPIICLSCDEWAKTWASPTRASPRHTSSSLAGNDWLSLLYNKGEEEELRRRRDKVYPTSHILTPGVVSLWSMKPREKGTGCSGGEGVKKSSSQTKHLLLQHVRNQFVSSRIRATKVNQESYVVILLCINVFFLSYTHSTYIFKMPTFFKITSQAEEK